MPQPLPTGPPPVEVLLDPAERHLLHLCEELIAETFYALTCLEEAQRDLLARLPVPRLDASEA